MRERRAICEARHAAGRSDPRDVYRLASLRRDLGDPLAAVALLEATPDLGLFERLMLAELCADLNTPARDEQARAIYDQVRKADAERPALASALAGLGNLHLRQGRPAEALPLYEAALALSATRMSTVRRYARLLRDAEGPQAPIAWFERQIDDGNACPPILAVWSGALAAAGYGDAAREAIGLGRFLNCSTASAPAGWPSLDAFNAALLDELTEHPARRDGRPRSASEQSWRVDEPLLTRSKVLPALEQLLAENITRHLAALAGDHPLVCARPADATVRYWAVGSDGPGHQSAHMHPAGWVSGVYYPLVPPQIGGGQAEDSADGAGCLLFVQPDRICGPGGAVVGPIVEPAARLFATFPSHAFHETRSYPEAWGARVCIAFDVEPWGRA